MATVLEFLNIFILLSPWHTGINVLNVISEGLSEYEIIILFINNNDRPPLWSSGQSSWLQPEAQVRYPALPEKKVAGLERGPLSLVTTTEELLVGKLAANV
jgi:hypothetical protein